MSLIFFAVLHLTFLSNSGKRHLDVFITLGREGSNNDESVTAEPNYAVINEMGQS